MLDSAFLETARLLIAADSVTERGNLRAVEVLEPVCRAAGLEPVRLPSPDTPDRDVNLLAGPGGGTAGAPLLLVTHLDTVDPGPRDRWQTDPFVFTVQRDRARGLGVADVKLDALCKLGAAHRLRGEKLARPFYFLGTYGEEAGLRGARAFMGSPPFAPSAVLCGEPSELRVCNAHKGYAVVRVRIRSRAGTSFAASPTIVTVFEGKAAHSSTPHLGENAIDKAIDSLSLDGSPYAMYLQGGASANTIPARCEAVVYSRPGCAPSLPWAVPAPGVTAPPESEWANVTTMLPLVRQLRALWRESVAAMRPQADARFDPPGAIANLTKATTRADTVELTFDARLLPEHDADALISRFIHEAGHLSSSELEVTVAIDRNAGGMSLPEDAPLVATCSDVLRSMGLNGVPVAKPTSTEAGVFARAGIPAVVLGPSPSKGNAHTANEYAMLDQVERAIDVYTALIRRLCS